VTLLHGLPKRGGAQARNDERKEGFAGGKLGRKVRDSISSEKYLVPYFVARFHRVLESLTIGGTDIFLTFFYIQNSLSLVMNNYSSSERGKQ
jgi:hypothetical protein